VHTGFEGHYTNKASSTREGEATFYRTSRFRLAARQDITLRDCFKDLLHPAAQDSTAADATAQHTQRSKRAKRHAQFEPMLRSSPHLQRVLQGVATVAQMTLLEPVTQPDATPSPSSGQQIPTSDSSTAAAAAEGSICIVNSHFFFHPRASHVRNIHTAAVMSEVQAFINETLNGAASCSDSQQPTAATAAITAATTSHRADEPASAASAPGSSQQPAMLFCGDLNSDLNDGPPG
jgi:2',5'-phosphodiesterase